MAEIFLDKTPVQKKPDKLAKEIKSTTSQGTCCNLDQEFDEEDERLLKHVKLTEEQLKMKETDNEAFWKTVAETLRCDLADCLDENKELYRLQELMEEDKKELNKENVKLDKLAKEAGEICEEYLNMSD